MELIASNFGARSLFHSSRVSVHTVSKSDIHQNLLTNFQRFVGKSISGFLFETVSCVCHCRGLFSQGEKLFKAAT